MIPILHLIQKHRMSEYLVSFPYSCGDLDGELLKTRYKSDGYVSEVFLHRDY